MAIAREHITGLVLAGGRGSRMGGLDKGLQPYRGMPLVGHVLQRLAPQVGRVMISANRHLNDYRAFGAPVLPDAEFGFEGPLAGVLAGLDRCESPFLVCVPCDTPLFPLDLVSQLASALGDADLAVGCTAVDGRLQPLFGLMKATLREDLRRHLGEGGRKAGTWVRRQQCAVVPFKDASAFLNANTVDDLAQLEHGDAK